MEFINSTDKECQNDASSPCPQDTPSNGSSLSLCQVCNDVSNITREWYVLQLLLPTVTLMANTLTCYALCKARGMKFYLRVTFLNLNVTDIISSVVYLYHIIFSWNSFQVNAECVVRYATYVFTVILTLTTVCCLTVDRFWSVSRPFLYERLAGPGYVLGAIGCTWAVTIVYVCVGFSFLRPDAEACIYPLLMRKEIHFLYSVAGMVVISVIVCLNVTMYVRARTQITKISQTLVGEARHEYLARTNLRAAVTTLCIVVPFVLLNTPSYCLMFYFGLDQNYTKRIQALYTINALTNLSFLNSLINPVIYIWRSSHVREALLGIFRCCECKRRSPRLSQTSTSTHVMRCSGSVERLDHAVSHRLSTESHVQCEVIQHITDTLDKGIDASHSNVDDTKKEEGSVNQSSNGKGSTANERFITTCNTNENYTMRSIQRNNNHTDVTITSQRLNATQSDIEEGSSTSEHLNTNNSLNEKSGSPTEYLDTNNSDTGKSSRTSEHLNTNNSDNDKCGSTTEYLDTNNSDTGKRSSTSEHLNTNNSGNNKNSSSSEHLNTNNIENGKDSNSSEHMNANHNGNGKASSNSQHTNTNHSDDGKCSSYSEHMMNGKASSTGEHMNTNHSYNGKASSTRQHMNTNDSDNGKCSNYSEHMNIYHSDNGQVGSTSEHMNTNHCDSDKSRSTTEYLDTNNSDNAKASSTSEHKNSNHSDNGKYVVTVENT